MPICHEESFGSRMVKTLLIVPLFLYALLNKLAALILGLFLVIISLIPIPRLGQWCPAFIALFDGLLAITVGLILYVLILWAFAGEPSDDEKNDNFAAEFNEQKNENKEEEETVSETKEGDGEGMTEAQLVLAQFGDLAKGETRISRSESRLGNTALSVTKQSRAVHSVGGGVGGHGGSVGSGSQNDYGEETAKTIYRDSALIGLNYRTTSQE